MRKLYLEQLKSGMLLGQNIMNDQGQLLLTSGTPLTVGYIEGLRLHGHSAIWVLDGVTDDVQPPDILSPALRSSTSRHLQELFSTAQVAAAGEESQAHRKEEAVFAEIAAATRPRVAELFQDAESLVNEVANAKAISGVMSLKTHDSYTFEHSVEVAIAAVMLGQKLYMEPFELEIIALGCLFHDLGKVMVPREILNKPGRLTPEEFEVVKRHSEVGYQMVRRILGNTSIFARQIARQHHERQDGKGYPQGLKGDNTYKPVSKRGFGQGLIIPAAEIAAVADVYSALASDRPYRPSMKPDEIVATMRDMAGSHLNRDLVSRFLSILPMYSVCSEVMVTSGKLKGYRGIVTSIGTKLMDRPVIRILCDAQGKQVTPFEVDLSEEDEMELEEVSYADVEETAVPALA